MRTCRNQISSRQTLILGLFASAVLAFTVAFVKFNGDSGLLPAVLDKSVSSLRSLVSLAPALPPALILKTCDWGVTHRHNLVVLVAGDTSEHTRWLDDFENANWDLAIIYYGYLKTGFECKQCMHVELGYGAKWKLIYQFTQSGAFAEHYVDRYTQVYVPDDDIVQLGSSINRAFDIQQVYGLQLAQPALCSRVESDTIHVTGMYMESPTVLRYTTFIEIMVTLFSMEFFKGNVTKTLATADSGYGLDWVWPFLLGYPQDKIAIIDELCVVHPKKDLQRDGKSSMYAANSKIFGWQFQEELRQWKRFGYKKKALQEDYGMGFQERARLGQIWQPWYQKLLKQGDLVEKHAAPAVGRGPNKGVYLAQPSFSLTPWLWPAAGLNSATAQASNKGRAAELLIVLVIVEGRQPMWLQDPTSKAWNVIVAAPKGMQQVTCPDCLFVHRYNASEEQGRYQVLYQLMQTAAWDELVVGRHKYLYFPEEGIIQDVSAIKTLLRLTTEANLDLAHLTWCSTLDSHAQHMMYMQSSPIVVLRYGTYVDTGAPLFSWPFLQRIVLPTLVEAQTGEGLGYLWPYLAGYPMDKIAVIDCACAMRPNQARQPGSMLQYTATRLTMMQAQKRAPNVTYMFQPAPVWDEAQEQYERFNYNPIRLGKPVKTKQVVGFVEQPWYTQLMASGNFQAVTTQKWLVSAIRTDKLPVAPLKQ